MTTGMEFQEQEEASQTGQPDLDPATRADIDRLADYLSWWAVSNPLQSPREGRDALLEKYGIKRVRMHGFDLLLLPSQEQEVSEEGAPEEPGEEAALRLVDAIFDQYRESARSMNEHLDGMIARLEEMTAALELPLALSEEVDFAQRASASIERMTARMEALTSRYDALVQP